MGNVSFEVLVETEDEWAKIYLEKTPKANVLNKQTQQAKLVRNLLDGFLNFQFCFYFGRR